MQCTIDPEAILPSDYTYLMTKYLLQKHMQQVIKILEDPNMSTAKHHSIAIK